MKGDLLRLLFWTPRILSTVFAAFAGVLALDAFSEDDDFWKMVVAFLVHLLPAGMILAALLVACRWEAIGGLLFVALGVVFWAGTRSGWFTFGVFLIGGLFLLSWLLRRSKSVPQQTCGNTP